MKKAIHWFSPVAAPTLILLSFLCLMASIAGCRHLDPAGVYQGDAVLYHAELATPTAYELLHTFVSWEKQNRVALAKRPAIRKHADYVRANAKQWFNTANALHDACKANPTQVNKDALTTALGVLEVALIEANGYMLKAATQPK